MIVTCAGTAKMVGSEISERAENEARACDSNASFDRVLREK